MVSTSRILVTVVQMCYEAKDWDALNENIMLLSKRRSQLKQVRHCDLLMSYGSHSLKIITFVSQVIVESVLLTNQFTTQPVSGQQIGFYSIQTISYCRNVESPLPTITLNNVRISVLCLTVQTA